MQSRSLTVDINPAPNSERADGFSMLTPREREIAVLLAEQPDLTDKEIAAMLRISVDTVRQHFKGIFNALGLSSRTAVAVNTYRVLLNNPREIPVDNVLIESDSQPCMKLDPESGIVRMFDVKIQLGRQELRVFKLLLANQGHICTFRQLVAAAWIHSLPELNRIIFRLRRKLLDDTLRLIINVPRCGYVLLNPSNDEFIELSCDDADRARHRTASFYSILWLLTVPSGIGKSLSELVTIRDVFEFLISPIIVTIVAGYVRKRLEEPKRARRRVRKSR